MRTVLAGGDLLPLTCTRAGTCCHGKDIRITPWELARLARARGLPATDFRERFTVEAGTRLRLGGAGWRGLPACSQYDQALGCSVHADRPFACRLYPLGREVQDGAVRIIHEGRAFPCLDGCPEVAQLSQLRVAEYLEGQEIGPFAVVRDAYLEMSQDLAEAAIAFAVEGGSDDRRWVEAWRLAIARGPAVWPEILGPWYDALTTPDLEMPGGPPEAWLQAHAVLLQERAEAQAPAAACVRLFCSALLLFQAVGGESALAGRRWLARAGV